MKSGLKIVFDDPATLSKEQPTGPAGLNIIFDDFTGGSLEAKSNAASKETSENDSSEFKISFDDFHSKSERNSCEIGQNLITKSKSVHKESGLKISFDDFQQGSLGTFSDKDKETKPHVESGLKITFDDFNEESARKSKENTQKPEVKVSLVDTSAPKSERKEVNLSFSMDSLRQSLDYTSTTNSAAGKTTKNLR